MFYVVFSKKTMFGVLHWVSHCFMLFAGHVPVSCNVGVHTGTKSQVDISEAAA